MSAFREAVERRAMEKEDINRCENKYMSAFGKEMNVCEVCETCDASVCLYEKSNQYWCDSCADQVPCKNCGCWYFETESGYCDECACCNICGGSINLATDWFYNNACYNNAYECVKCSKGDNNYPEGEYGDEGYEYSDDVDENINL